MHVGRHSILGNAGPCVSGGKCPKAGVSASLSHWHKESSMGHGGSVWKTCSPDHFLYRTARAGLPGIYMTSCSLWLHLTSLVCGSLIRLRMRRESVIGSPYRRPDSTPSFSPSFVTLAILLQTLQGRIFPRAPFADPALVEFSLARPPQGCQSAGIFYPLRSGQTWGLIRHLRQSGRTFSYC